MYTTDRNDPQLIEGQKNETGQHDIYLVLSEEERKKGFVRPVRDTYIHVGKKIERYSDGRLYGKLIKMDDPEYETYKHDGYKKEDGWGGFILYPKGESSVIGKHITQEEVDAIVARKTHFGGCNTSTKMGQALAETYAREPKFYGRTFCCECNKHLAVEEFIWEDGSVVGS